MIYSNKEKVLNLFNLYLFMAENKDLIYRALRLLGYKHSSIEGTVSSLEFDGDSEYSIVNLDDTKIEEREWVVPSDDLKKVDAYKHSARVRLREYNLDRHTTVRILERIKPFTHKELLESVPKLTDGAKRLLDSP